jgi:hypothetical protein
VLYDPSAKAIQGVTMTIRFIAAVALLSNLVNGTDTNEAEFVRDKDYGRMGKTIKTKSSKGKGKGEHQKRPKGAEPNYSNIPEGSCLVFITSEKYLPSFGGIQEGDRKCQELASATSLLPNTDGNVFRAWLSSSNYSPATGFNSKNNNGCQYGYYLVDGRRIAADWNDIVSGNLENPINVQEDGETTMDNTVWTGTSASGTHENSCNDWTQDDSDALGLRGIAVSTSGSWTASVDAACKNGNMGKLYCFEDPFE